MRRLVAFLLLLFSLRRAAAEGVPVPPTLGRLEQAYRKAPSVELLYQMGEARRAQGQVLEAADLLRRYLEEAGLELDPKGRAELERFLTGDLGPGTEVAVSGEPGALVLLDEHVVGALPLSRPLLVAPGPHRLRLEQGRRRVETQLRLLPNRPLAVRFTLLPPLAVSSPTLAAVLLPDYRNLPEALGPKLWQRAGQAAAAERVLLIPREKLAAYLSAEKVLAGCLGSAPCQEKLAAHFEARYVLLLTAALQPASGRGEDRGAWRFTVHLHDAEVGATAAEGQDGCDGCNLQRSAEVLVELLRRMVQDGMTRPRGALEVVTRPAGAEVQVDGRVFGMSPLKKAVFAGTRELQLELPGYGSHKEATAVADGEEKRLSVDLQPLPRPAPVAALPPEQPAPAARKPLYRRWWFWGALGVVAAGAVAAGVAGSYAGQGRTFPNPRVLDF